MTTLESLKNLSVASGCGKCTSDNVADAIQFMADNYKRNMFDGSWLRGYLSLDSGEFVASNNNLTTEHYMTCEAGDTIDVKMDQQREWVAIFFYAEEGASPLSHITDNRITDVTGTAPEGATRFKVSMGESFEITPADVTMQVFVN